MVKFINVPLVVSLRNMESEVRLIDAVLLQTEPDMLFYTLSMVNLYDTTPTTSLNTSLWT